MKYQEIRDCPAMQVLASYPSPDSLQKMTGKAMNVAERQVRDFYDKYGWVNPESAAFFNDFSRAYYPYHERVNARTIQCFSGLNGRLLLAGGGNMPETHVAICDKFPETTCLDISKVAIDIAKSKLKGRGEFILGSILQIPKPANYFDASYCAHVIYHIEKDQQHIALRELIRVTKPGGRIVVIYRNLESLPHWFLKLNRLPLLPRLWKQRRRKRFTLHNAQSPPPLYFFAYPLNWWAQFADQCDIAIRPWDVMSNEEEEVIFINETIASMGYRLCSWFESAFPDRGGRWWSYPLIILTKK